VDITLSPLVVSQEEKAKLTISHLLPGASYRLVLRPVRQFREQVEHVLVSDRAGVIRWEQPITWNGETLCEVFAGENPMPLSVLRFYAAPPAYLNRRPVRCDFHIHTTYSDGHNSVAEMVLRGRELGLDALAITDHNYYPGSLEAAEIAKTLGMNLVCLPGEEVSLEAAHLLSIGARAGVGNSPPRKGYAGLRDAIDQIRALGGKAFICHPYWLLNDGHFHLPSPEYDRLLQEGGFDGVELLGDVLLEDNLRSLLRYFELLPDQRPPILGNSDTHRNTHTYGGYWTLVLAKDLSAQGILDAIAEGYSVACVRLTLAPPGQDVLPRLLPFGGFELGDFTLFLDKVYFPTHDRLCREQAGLGKRVLGGERQQTDVMAQLELELEQFYLSSWGKLSGS